VTRGRILRQRGAALLIVLWSTVVVAGLAVVVGGTARTDIAVARRQVEEAQARYLAQAAVVHGALLLLSQRDTADLAVIGRSMLSYSGRDIDIRFHDECGKVDLNTAWGDLLRGIVESHAAEIGVPAPSTAILDWRDPDSRPGPGGAEDADYRAAGRAHGARNGPFDSIAELQQVLGVPAPLMASIRDDVTVDCLNAGVDPLVASEAVVAAIPTVDADSRRAFAEARQRYIEAGAVGPEPRLAGGGRYVAPSSGLAVEVEAIAEGGTGWRAVIWLTGDGALPLRFRTWERTQP
jgi:general secretion pathway protein K